MPLTCTDVILGTHNLAKLKTGLDEEMLTRIIDEVLPRVQERRTVCWELEENPALAPTNAAVGSQRLLALANTLIAAGAHGVATLACPFCGRTGNQLRSMRDGRRCCHCCFNRGREETCCGGIVTW